MAEPTGEPAEQVAQAAQSAVARGGVYVPPHRRGPVARDVVRRVRGRGPGRGGPRARGPVGPTAWDMAKCQWGVPDGFDATKAAQTVNSADFSDAVYVNTSEEEGRTRQAFTYVDVDGFRLCVVGHVHPREGRATVAGNAYIPGFANWEMPTPAAAVGVIDGLEDAGAFPGEARYPHPV